MNFLPRTIALVGCTGIDPIDVFSLARNHWAHSLLLTGNESAALAEKVNEMLEKWGLPEPEVRTGAINEAARAAVIILNPSDETNFNGSEIELVRKKAARLRSDIEVLRDEGINGTLLIIAEPTEVLTSVALNESGLEPSRVLGMEANSLDAQITKHTPVWCTGMRGNSVFIDHCDPNCVHFESVVDDAARISGKELNYSGNRIAGMALCVSRICQAILNDEHEILPVTTWLNGQYGLTGVSATVPCVIGRNGVERIVELPITSAERQRMRSRALNVLETAAKLDPDQKRANAASL